MAVSLGWVGGKGGSPFCQYSLTSLQEDSLIFVCPQSQICSLSEGSNFNLDVSTSQPCLRLIGAAAHLPDWAGGSGQIGAVVGAQGMARGALQVMVL